MKTYMTNDGATFKAKDDREVVVWLRTQDWTMSDEPHEKFRKRMADRVLQQTGQAIAHDSDAALVAGLLRVGLIKEAV